MEVYEGAQLISQPGESDLIFPSTCLEFFNTPIGEVHIISYARLAHGAEKLMSSSLFAQRERGELSRIPRHYVRRSSDHQRAPDARRA